MKRQITVLLSIFLPLTCAMAASATETDFPQQIKYKVRKDSILSGRFNLIFGDDPTSTAGTRHQITLSNFETLGFSSDQQLTSFVNKNDLSLYGHAVLDKDQQLVRSVRLDNNCKSAIGNETTKCFKYQKGGSNPIQTEIFTPYKAIDLISSIVVASQAVSDKSFKKSRDFNFIFNKSTKQVSLVFEENKKIATPLGNYQATVLSLRHKNSGIELYRFYIGKDKKGTFPLKMLYDDNGSKIEFIADEVD